MYDPRSNVFPRGGGIGQGLGMAIGAALADETRPTLGLVGDGGLAVHFGELLTMAQEKPWLVLLVPNDGGYGVLRNMQRGSGSREYAVDLHTPDFAKLADAIGVAHRVIRGAAEAESVLADAVALRGPVIVEVDLSRLRSDAGALHPACHGPGRSQMTTIGICGAGIGGLTAAIALREQGLDVRVYEQTRTFGRVGADINLTPNAVRALNGIGVGPALRDSAARPRFRISRMWDTGAETSRLPMSDTAERDYGAPQLTLHRADLLAALEQRAPAVSMGKRLERVVFDKGAELHFTDGSTDRVDVLVGADGSTRRCVRRCSDPTTRPSPGSSRFVRWCPRSGCSACRTWTPSPSGGARSRKRRSSRSR